MQRVSRNKNSQTTANFFEDVHDVVRLIPRGRVTSYGAIGKYLGLKSSARMVGWALHACPRDVPAHRVVNRNGLLTGKHNFKTPTTMERFLKKEGVAVEKDKVKDFPNVFWDPSEELR